MIQVLGPRTKLRPRASRAYVFLTFVLTSGRDLGFRLSAGDPAGASPRAPSWLGLHLPVDDLVDLVRAQDLLLEQGLGDPDELVLVLLDELLGPAVVAHDDLLDLVVDALGRPLAEVLVHGQVAAEEDEVVALAEGQRAEVGHAPLADHLAGDLGGLLEVVGRAGGRLAEEDHLGHAAGHEDGELGLEVVLGVGVAVVEGQLLGEARGPSRGG